jgi:hypothetical protein
MQVCVRIAALVFAVTLSGCGYKAGSFKSGLRSFEGERNTVGCLDVAVAPLADAEATGPVSAIRFGNRCDAPVVVDIGAIRATAYDPDGRPTRMIPYDPEHAIRPLRMDARMVGGENIEWHQARSGANPPVRLCLDLAGLDAEAPRGRPVIICIPAQGSWSMSRVVAR